MDIKKPTARGKHFRITIKGKSVDSKTDGMAYSNALIIEQKNGESWRQAYSTGMMQYRGAHNWDIDDWDLSLGKVGILEESKNEVVYALTTGVGKVKVYGFKKGDESPEQLESFSVSDHEATKKRIELLKTVVTDQSAFNAYITEGLQNRWHVTDTAEMEDRKIIVLLLDHADRDYDAISDLYKICIWIQGQGFWKSGAYRTGLHHPGGKFYRVGISMKATVTNHGQDFAVFSVEVGNRSQQWKQTHQIRVQWPVAESDDFEQVVGKMMNEVVQQSQHDHPLYLPTVIKESVIDSKLKVAAFILFEQIDTDRMTESGEGWLGDQFRYSLWVIKGNAKPRQIHEEHAYIRPHTKSDMTGTRGQDCSLKDLKISGGRISITHMTDAKFEEQKPETITFKL
ncbi:hypothetical protein M1432_02320 [Patescibacteria group bacterium]|nr:hypothetical protein [Patescibacteria group bacterium]